jgi:hypothetical protein
MTHPNQRTTDLSVLDRLAASFVKLSKSKADLADAAAPTPAPAEVPVTKAADRIAALAALSTRVDALQARVQARAAQATPDTDAIIANAMARAEELLAPIRTGLEAELARRGIQRGNTPTVSVDGMRFGEAIHHLLHNAE